MSRDHREEHPTHRDDKRTECIEALRGAVNKEKRGNGMSWETAEVAFDSLRGLARVVPIEATEEMIVSGKQEYESDEIYSRESIVKSVFQAMSSAGDLTNPPEKKL